MKSLQQPESAPGEFEGRTLDEAVQLARQELGAEVFVRCWKIRRGGLFGFFARETFVAGLTLPADATRQVKSSRLARPRRETQEAREATVGATSRSMDSSGQLATSIFSQALLADLVEATRDEVTLASDTASDTAFSEVLAQAEAALVGSPAIARGEESASSDPPVPGGPERIEGLRASLAGLGVPGAYQPDESEATLDGLVRSLAQLPSARPVPVIGGSLIVVVGSRRDALIAAQQVVTNLGLDLSDLIVAERTSAGRQRVARRRTAKRVTVLVVEASLNSRGLDQVAVWIDRLKPDYVLGAVPATAKHSDFGHWRAQLGQVDALALLRLANTTTVAELMGEIPIALLDGSEASTLRWVLVLLNSIVKREH